MKNKPLIKNKFTRVILTVLLLTGYGCTVQAEEKPLPPSTVLEEIVQLIHAAPVETPGEEVGVNMVEELPEEIKNEPICLDINEDFPECEE